MDGKTVVVVTSSEAEDTLLTHLLARGWRAIGLAPPAVHEGRPTFWERAAALLAKAHALLLPVWMPLDGTSAEPLLRLLRQAYPQLPILLLASGAVEPTWAAHAAQRDALVRLVWPATTARVEDALIAVVGGEVGAAEGTPQRR